MAKSPQVKNSSKEKDIRINKIFFLETTSPYSLYYQNLFLSLKRFCNNVISFDRRMIYLKYGKEKMNAMLIEEIKKQKPDYIFTWLTWDELSLETLLKIRLVSPKTKTVVFFGDDDVQFEGYSRYYALFFDYCFVGQRHYIPQYKKEGIKDVFFTLMTNSDYFKPMNLEKKYDVTFIGSEKLDKSGRHDFVKYLLENGVNLKVFGPGWSRYHDIKDSYGGVLSGEEVIRIVNQSKINLSFTKNNYGENQLKGRIFELAYCKAFTLQEYFKEYEHFFKNGEEMITFKNKEDLLQKIKYYLNNEQKRVQIAKKAYKKATSNYNLHIELKNLFNKTTNKSAERVHKPLPEIKKKIVILKQEDFKNYSNLIKKINNADYIAFEKTGEYLPFKNYLQAYSLEKSGKDISCCDYYLYSKKLGDYMMFLSYDAFRNLNKEELSKLLDISQLMVTKSYFIKNIKLFEKILSGKKINFVNILNTVLVSIPLIRLTELRTDNYDSIKKSFNMKFIYSIYSRISRLKPDSFKFFLSILKESLNGKVFILRALFESLLNNDKWRKLSKFKSV